MEFHFSGQNSHENHVLQRSHRAVVFQLRKRVKRFVEERKRHLEVALVALEIVPISGIHVNDTGENVDVGLCGGVYVDRGCRHFAGSKGRLRRKRGNWGNTLARVMSLRSL